jgi:hypothetical protein
MVKSAIFIMMPTLSLCIKRFSNQTFQLFAPHPRPHQGEQLWSKPPLQILAKFKVMIKQSWNFKADSRLCHF